MGHHTDYRVGQIEDFGRTPQHSMRAYHELDNASCRLEGDMLRFRGPSATIEAAAVKL